MSDELPKELQRANAQVDRQQQRVARQSARITRAQERKRQRAALQKQKDAQNAALDNYRTEYAHLQMEYGSAKNDPAKLAELDKRKNELVQKYKNDMAATQDLEQYKKQYDDEQEQTSDEQEQTSDEQTSDEQTSDEQAQTSDEQTSDKENSLAKYLSSKGNELAEANAASVATNSLANYLTSKMPGGTPKEPNSVHLERQAAMHDIQAADEQKAAQKNNQIANRDYKVEAEKKAASATAANDSRKIQKMGNASAGAAALEREDLDIDYNTEEQRSDTQRAEGVKNQREMWGAKQTAEEERADANKGDHDYLQHQLYNNASTSLSMGGTPDNSTTAANDKQPQEEQPQEEQPQEEQPQEEQPQEEQPTTWDSAQYQHVINWLLGSSKGKDLLANPAGGGAPNSNAPDAALAQYIQQKYGVQPVATGKYNTENPDPNSWESLYIRDNGQKAKDAIEELRSGRASQFGGNSKTNYVRGADGQYRPA